MFCWFTDYEAEFDFEVDGYVAGDVNWGLGVWRWEDGRWWLEEEEGVFGAGVV